MSKNETIKNTLKQTKERRKEQACRSFIVKVDKSHLSQQKLDNLNKLFLEAKWFYNYAIANDPFGLDYKIKSVMVKVKDKFEERPLTILSSQMKQEILYDAQDSIINLSKKKANGGKVGQLKFKSYTQSIPLKQFGNTYKIINGKYIKIQNIKGWVDWKHNNVNQPAFYCPGCRLNFMAADSDIPCSPLLFKALP